MFRFQVPRGRDFWSWPPTIVILVLLVVALGLSTARVLRREWHLRKERLALEAKLASLRQERSSLEEQIRELESPQGIERLAKEKLGVKLEGEEVTIVVPEERSTSTGSKMVSFWEHVWRFILKLFPP